MLPSHVAGTVLVLLEARKPFANITSLARDSSEALVSQTPTEAGVPEASELDSCAEWVPDTLLCTPALVSAEERRCASERSLVE